MEKKGFTLVEVIASLVILGISMVSIMQVFSLGTNTTLYSKEKTTAANLLQRKVEEIKCKDFVIDVTGYGTYPDFPEYTFFVFQTPNYDSNTYLKRINVTISWDDKSGVTSSETMSTLVANY